MNVFETESELIILLGFLQEKNREMRNQIRGKVMEYLDCSSSYQKPQVGRECGNPGKTNMTVKIDVKLIKARRISDEPSKKNQDEVSVVIPAKALFSLV